MQERLEQTMPEDGEGDHLVKNAAELVAAANVADDHVIGIDNPEPFVVRGRLADLAQAAQSIMPSCTAAACPLGQPLSGHVHEAHDGLRQ